MDVTIVVSTFGDEKWEKLAEERALPSARSFGVPVIYNHGETLHDTRNQGLSQVETEYVCHLDADDELDSLFFEHISKYEGDVRVPSIQYFPNKPVMPRLFGHPHRCGGVCLLQGNWIVVGAVARTQLLKEVGGWKDYPVYEDFDLWQRCWASGAIITPVPEAVYVAHSTAAGRNRSLPPHEARKVQYKISKTNFPDTDFEWLLK